MPDKKHDRFLRIAQERKNHVLECLQALGNCSDPSSYTYEAKELPSIFQEIIGKLAEVWHRMSCHSPYPFVPFSLGQKEELAIDGKRCKWSALMTQKDVMEHLMEGGATFVALEPIREKYTKLFGDGMCCCLDYLGRACVSARQSRCPDVMPTNAEMLASMELDELAED